MTSFLKKRKWKKRNINFYTWLEENGDDANEIYNNDEAMVDLFFKKVIVMPRPIKFYRLGKPDSNKIRPFKSNEKS